MRVRRPKFDFSQAPARWVPTWEYAHQMNATSAWIPFLERFLNKVMAQAASRLAGQGPEAERIRGDVKTFIRQEANHYSLHAEFNSIMARHGFDLAPFERHFEAEFERLYKTKSLGFLLAYCEGFETLGPPAALVWLGETEDLLDGGDPNVVGLWKWHLMEEYEHRTVCHDVFHALHGGYFMRLYGFFYQLRHLQGMSKMVREYLMEREWATMTPEERQASERRAKEVSKRIRNLALPRLLRVLSPFYTPRKSREPALFRSHMATVENGLA